MAEPTEVLRQGMQLQMQCSDYLAQIEEEQSKRWEALRRVIEDAGKQYAAMRLDVVEAMQMDEGAPLWLSVVITVAIAFIPFEAITGVFFEKLTETTDKLLANSRKELDALERYAIRELDAVSFAAKRARAFKLAKRIKNTEQRVAKFAKLYEPEVHHMLVTLAHEVSESKAEHVLEKHKEEEKEEKKEREKAKEQEGQDPTDAPMVVVTQAMHKWIDSFVQVEDSARRQKRQQIRDLFDIATASDPAKEAKAKDEAAFKREAEREPRVPYRQSLPKAPTTSKAAIEQLTSLRDHLLPDAAKARTVGAKDLRDLQLLIESIIWCSTYDFTPVPVHGNVIQPRVFAPVSAPALTDALWKRLIARYIDPDTQTTYEKVGTIPRLGTLDNPSPAKGMFDAETRLAHYFSQILAPAVMDGNHEILRRVGPT